MPGVGRGSSNPGEMVMVMERSEGIDVRSLWGRKLPEFADELGVRVKARENQAQHLDFWLAE